MKWLYLTRPLHQNHFEKSFSIPEDQLPNFLISVDGGLMAVNADTVAPWLLDEEIKAIRFGYKTPPKHIFVSNMEVLLKTCAIMIEIDDGSGDEDDDDEDSE